MAHNHDLDHQGEHAGHDAHGGHGVEHSGHEGMFRQRFWVCLLLTIPVLLYSPMLQQWFGVLMPELSGSVVTCPLFAIAIFLYGGAPFLQMALPEIRNRQQGMMPLISLAITVSFAYSLFADAMGGFFLEMATLIDIMLLGHWLEMRSARQASGVLNELAKLMPDTGEHLMPNGQIHVMPMSALKAGRTTCAYFTDACQRCRADIPLRNPGWVCCRDH